MPRISRRILAGGMLSVGAIIVWAALGAKPQVIHISATFAQGSVAELASRASALAVVTPTGRRRVSWNSDDGRAWGSFGVDSFIYADVEVTVDAAVRGDLPTTMWLRDVGGTSDGYEMDFDGATDLHEGSTYLVFLAMSDFPTKSGTEKRWSVVRLGQGAFSHSGTSWTDSVQGLVIRDSDLSTIAATVK